MKATGGGESLPSPRCHAGCFVPLTCPSSPWPASEDVVLRMWSRLTLELDPGRSKAPPLLPCPWSVRSAHLPCLGVFPGRSLLRLRCRWASPDGMCDRTR